MFAPPSPTIQAGPFAPRWAFSQGRRRDERAAAARVRAAAGPPATQGRPWPLVAHTQTRNTHTRAHIDGRHPLPPQGNCPQPLVPNVPVLALGPVSQVYF